MLAQNEIKNLVWNMKDWFEETALGRVSDQAYIIGFRLYKLALKMVSVDTEDVADNYVYVRYNKEYLAEELRTSTQVLSDKKVKKRGCRSVWQELEDYGFRFDNGNEGESSLMAVPLYIANKEVDTLACNYTKNSVRKNPEAVKVIINNMKMRIDGTWELLIKRKWNEIDYNRINPSKVYKITTLDIGRDNVLRAKAQRSFWCLLEQNGIPFKSPQDDKHSLFYKILNEAGGRYQVVQNEVFGLWDYTNDIKTNTKSKEFNPLYKMSLDEITMLMIGRVRKVVEMMELKRAAELAKHMEEEKEGKTTKITLSKYKNIVEMKRLKWKGGDIKFYQYMINTFQHSHLTDDCFNYLQEKMQEAKALAESKASKEYIQAIIGSNSHYTEANYEDLYVEDDNNDIEDIMSKLG